MKKTIPATAVLGILVSIAAFISSCVKQGIKDPVTLDRAAGKWSINAIRLNVSYGGPETKDSTLPWVPGSENFVSFDGVSRMQYQFNDSGLTEGEYSLSQNDSITMTMNGITTKWKILLLTPTNFNIEKTVSNNKDFPGATVKTFQGFVR